MRPVSPQPPSTSNQDDDALHSISRSISSLLRVRASSPEDESLTEQAERMCGDNETLCDIVLVTGGLVILALIGFFFLNRHKKKKAAQAEEERKIAEERQKKKETDLIKEGEENQRRKTRELRFEHEIELKLQESGMDADIFRESMRKQKQHRYA
ncbi:hypothetical protein IAT40_006197 [Kwoniella sp. CBS 6097]